MGICAYAQRAPIYANTTHRRYCGESDATWMDIIRVFQEEKIDILTASCMDTGPTWMNRHDVETGCPVAATAVPYRMRSPKLLGRCAGDDLREWANRKSNWGDYQDELPCLLIGIIDRGKMRLIHFHATVISHSELWRATRPSIEALSNSGGTPLISHAAKPQRQCRAHLLPLLRNCADDSVLAATNTNVCSMRATR